MPAENPSGPEKREAFAQRFDQVFRSYGEAAHVRREIAANKPPPAAPEYADYEVQKELATDRVHVLREEIAKLAATNIIATFRRFLERIGYFGHLPRFLKYLEDEIAKERVKLEQGTEYASTTEIAVYVPAQEDTRNKAKETLEGGTSGT